MAETQDPAAELEALQARMAEVKTQVTEELIRDWPSPWRNDAMTNAKVTGRLSSHKEYQALMVRQRELNSQLGVVPVARKSEEGEDPMASYANQLAKASNEAEK